MKFSLALVVCGLMSSALLVDARGVVNSIRRCTDLKSQNDFFRFFRFFLIFSDVLDFFRFLDFFGIFYDSWDFWGFPYDFWDLFTIFVIFRDFLDIFQVFKTYSCEKRGKYKILLLNIHFKNSDIGSNIILIIKKNKVKR